MNDKQYYYNVADDVAAYPDAWCIIAIGGRGTGKTYGALKDCYLNHRQFVFVKRTNDDVELLCAGAGRYGKKEEGSADISPFKPINRDLNTNVHPFTISKGLAGFWECEQNEDGDNVPKGESIGKILSLNAVSKYSGFDMSDADWMIFDEFVPRSWERVLRSEGDQMLDLYKTIARDREHRGRQPLKLILLANSVNISCPATNILEVSDAIAEAHLMGKEYHYIKDRGILIHIIRTSEEFHHKEEQTILYQAMNATAWGQMAFENNFAYNDFSAVKKLQLKNYRPIAAYIYKRKYVYVYQKDGNFYLCKSKANLPIQKIYDLQIERDQKRFYYDYAIDLQNSSIEGYVYFETYGMYELITNYHKIFVLR